MVEAEARPTTGSRRSDRWGGRPHAADAVLGVGIVAQLVISVLLTRHGWFFLDAWHYILRRGAVPEADEGLLEPWGGHWQTIPILLYRGLYAGFGMRTYVPYVLVAILLHLVITVLIYLILQRVGASRWVAVAVSWCVLFFGAGGEAFLWDGPIPLTLGLAFSLGAVLVATGSGFAGRSGLVVAALLVAAVMCSATGVVGAVVVAALALASSGWRAVRVIGPAAGLFLIWFLAFGRGGGRVNLHGWDWARVPEFAWTGLTGGLEGFLAIPGSGPVILVGLVLVTLLARDVPAELRALAWAGILGALAQMTLAATAALTFGNDASLVSRYKYMVFVMFAPSLALAVTALLAAVRRADLRARTGPALVGLVLVVFFMANSLIHERYESQYIQSASSEPRAWALGTRAAVEAGEVVLTPTPTGPFTGDIDIRLLTEPNVLASLPARAATPQQRVDAESQFFVGVRPGPSFDLFGPAVLELDGFDPGSVEGPGCRDYTATSLDPTITLAVQEGAEIGVTSPATSVTTSVSRDGVDSSEREWAVPSGALYVASTAKDASLRITFHAGGPYTICTAS